MGFPNPNADLTIEGMLKRLNESEMVEKAFNIKCFSIIEVLLKSGRVVLLHVCELFEDQRMEVDFRSNFENNIFVTEKDLKIMDEINFYVYSEVLFNPETGIENYYEQFKVLTTAADIAFFYDTSAWKCITKEYVEFMENIDKETMIKNMYTIVTYENWIFTNGLKRFGLNDLEIMHHNQEKSSEVFLERLVYNMFEYGNIISEKYINEFEFYGYILYPIEKALEIFEEKYILDKDFRGEEFLNDSQVILIFNENKINENNIVKSIDFTNFSNSDRFYLPSEVDSRNNILAANTFDLLKETLSDNVKILSNVQVKFRMRTNDDVEIIFGYINEVFNDELSVNLLNDSFFSDLKIGDEVRVKQSEIYDWNLDVDLSVTPYNVFGLLKPEIKNHFENKTYEC